MENFVLKEIEPADYETIAQWLADSANMVKICGTTFDHPLSSDAFIEYFVSKPARDNDRHCFKWVNTFSGVIYGMISFTTIDWKNDYGHIGLVAVAPTLRRSGVGTQMIESMLERGFNSYHFNRIDLVVLESNVDAYRFYVNKVGFTDEGLIRDVIKVGNDYLSWHSLSILKQEWKQRQM